MTITLRRASDGSPVGAGEKVYLARDSSAWTVDNWSVGTTRVYARPLNCSAPLVEFRPSEFGLYIGHEMGQPVSSIKWGGKPSPALKVAHVVAGLRKAAGRAKDCPDSLVSRALLCGVEDALLQIVIQSGDQEATRALLELWEEEFK